MIATIVVIAVILVTMGTFYWRSSLMTMLATVLSAIFASVVAFTYYEPIANFIIRKGWFMELSHGLSFLILFFLTLLLMQALSDLILRSKIDLGKGVHIAFTVGCGLFAGLLIAGHLLIGLSLLPVSPKFYLRYSPERPLNLTTLGTPSSPLFNPDGMSASLYSWISRGSLSGHKSFAAFHPEFIRQIHVNRWALANGISPILSPIALKLPSGAQKPVRTRDFPDNPKLTVIRLGIRAAEMKSGGANDKDGNVSLILAQVPVIAVGSEADRYKGTGTLLYPEGVVEDGVFKPLELDQALMFDSDNFTDPMVWLDLAYKAQDNLTPVLLTFKRNAIVELSKSVPSSSDIEQNLEPEKTTPVRFDRDRPRT